MSNSSLLPRAAPAEGRAAAPRLFGRRKGRPLRARKAKLMEELLPKLAVALPETGLLDLHKLLGSPQAWLEIGFGGGEHLIAQAKLHPDISFIGAESFVNGVASFLDHAEKNALANARVYPGDARLLLDALPPGSIDRCFLLYPDPWPKARHAERRFIGPGNLPRLGRALKKGAELRIATDHPKLAEWIRDAMRQAEDFELLADTGTPPPDWVPTRYEQKALKAGRKPVYLNYRRK